MEKTPIRYKRRDTKPIRIKNIHVNKLKKIGEGDQQKGLERLIETYEIVKKNPEEVCMSHIENFMDDLQRWFGDNHYEHFANFPVMVRQGLKTGHLDPKFLKKRLEEPIDKFTGGK